MNKVLRRVLILGVLVLVFLFSAASVYVVEEGEYATVTQFGEIKHIRNEAGLYVKLPFLQDISRLTKKQMIYNISSSEVLTADKKAMIVDSYAIWKIEDARTFIRTVNNIPEMQKRIDASTYSVIKNIMGQLEQSDIISDSEAGRSTLNREITSLVAQNLAPYGIRVQSIEIKRFDLPEDNMNAVYTRMISERSQMAASYQAEGEYEAAKIRNETDKEIAIVIGDAKARAQRLRGEGEEEYMRILKDVYQDEDKAALYLFVRELDALKVALVGQKTVVLGPDSPIAQIINQTQQLKEEPVNGLDEGQ